ncbi:cysteine--1-D-myo-inosityl 2-amino-2-deoxy-alpha-D-glucopyranoside ligase [Actinoplanes sp. RD1]|uniref:cysteine--1-D-myo-inosityl 2-amino-2-deoxy-alpha-D-glucopyranoside ligase n=1 Tax=Actinoplanes sp. RD1 TaxID=3064538 RepID=UPI0027404DFE|nr:cysteine--1-D-myo-inosityl 2-amino-2-deoxy-alpha-D-glucopyranoside ligase [Actinoplanes sp. RD1]
MDAWTGHEVPSLPGRGALPELFDSARREVAPTAPGETATMYVCGITPYDATHLGHAATMITFDLVQRLWRDAGVPVTYVQNVTDIDDPLLERANRDGEDWIVLAMRETALFREDMEALRMIPPAHYVGAVESIPRIAGHVRELMADGAAYALEDGTGDVYFDLAAAPRFGYESNLSREEMLVLSAERGGDPERPGKRDPLDPLLWRGARDGEPAWDGGDLGPGRPGWHIECATIALGLLGTTIDVQGGGSDLLFPHHECSAAHAERLTGDAPFASHYVHAGMIGLDGEKMSKSKGNLVFVSRLRGDGVDPMAVRLGLMSGHYRTDRSWTDDVLKEGEKRLARWRAAAAAPAGPSGEGLLAAVREALGHDLDTPAALALVDAWADAATAGAGDDAAAPALMAKTVDALLGVRL